MMGIKIEDNLVSINDEMYLKVSMDNNNNGLSVGLKKGSLYYHLFYLSEKDKLISINKETFDKLESKGWNIQKAFSCGENPFK